MRRQREPGKESSGWHVRRRLALGVLTAVPLAITFFIIKFLFDLLARVGRPLAEAAAKAVRSESAFLAALLESDLLLSLLGVVIVLAMLYGLGVAAGFVVGRKLLDAIDRLMKRIPVIQTVYGAIKQLVDVLQERPSGVDRVVLIEFPTPEMKTVGLVTRTMRDEATGRELAAVYVPTTPNPTSGYLEIVPVERIVSTDWTVDEAMRFIVSGGAVGPDTMPYSQSTAPPPGEGPALAEGDPAAKS